MRMIRCILLGTLLFLALSHLHAEGKASASNDPSSAELLEQMDLPSIDKLATSSNTVVRIWSVPVGGGTPEVHQIIESGSGQKKWDYVTLGPTNNVNVDLSKEASRVWAGVTALGLLDMPDQKNQGAKGNAASYTIQVSVNGVSKTYTISKPDQFSKPEDAKMSCIMELLDAAAVRKLDTRENWLDRRRREKSEGAAKLDSYIGKTFDTVETKSRGKLEQVRILRRKSDQYIVRHSRGTAKVPCIDIIGLDEEK